ncbi:MAG: YheT family hydrolase [Salibacteraceae bacterium]
MDQFTPSVLLKNGHLSTIWPTLFRKNNITFSRTRINTNDQDFLDLDWKTAGNEKLLIIGHGLEGSSSSSYVIGLAQNAIQKNYDVLAINWRGCSGEPNNRFESYHTGKSNDLRVVINHILKKYSYPSIYFAGFSMGGNIGLKYAGEIGKNIDSRIKKIVAVSTPVDLESSSYQLAKTQNMLYMFRFLRTLKEKYLEKVKLFPKKELDTKKILSSKTFLEFDEHFTAPANGFKTALDYWTKSSSKPYLLSISVPCLIINAQNDPFLATECYPYDEVASNKHLTMLVPKYGGHVGFIVSNKNMEITWAEKKILEYFAK